MYPFRSHPVNDAPHYVEIGVGCRVISTKLRHYNDIASSCLLPDDSWSHSRIDSGYAEMRRRPLVPHNAAVRLRRADTSRKEQRPTECGSLRVQERPLGDLISSSCFSPEVDSPMTFTGGMSATTSTGLARSTRARGRDGFTRVARRE